MKNARKMLSGALCTALVLAMSACGSTPGGNTVQDTAAVSAVTESKLEVPDFSGYTRDQIQLKYPKLNIIYDESYGSKEKGKVLSQDPLPGTVIGADDRITIVISVGEKLVEVDDYTNRNIEDAKSLIEKQGLVCEIVREENDSVTKNCIIRTLPSPRTKVEKGSVITCYVSYGSSVQEIRVPQMKGLSIEEATKLAEENNITLQISYDNESDAEPGTVIDQTIDADTVVEPQTRVGVTISGENSSGVRSTSINVTLKNGVTGEYEFKYYIDGTLQEDMTKTMDLELIPMQADSSRKITWEVKGTDVHTYSVRVTSLATGKSGILYEMEVDFTQDPPSKNHHDTFNGNIFQQLSAV